MNRVERTRERAGISTEKIRNATKKLYETMCEDGLRLNEAKIVVKELGYTLDEAERRSPNTRLNEIPNPRQS